MQGKPPRRTPNDEAAAQAERDRSPVAAAKSVPGRDEYSAPSCGHGRTSAVPEGRRRRLAGGKSAAADAAPGNGHEWLHAPAGHRRNYPRCWASTGGSTCPRRRAVAGMLEEDSPEEFLRCPAGARLVRRDHRGPRPLTRACPRLISCGVPPGRRGGTPCHNNAANSSPVARISPLHGTSRPARRPFLPSHSFAPNSPGNSSLFANRGTPPAPARLNSPC